MAADHRAAVDPVLWLGRGAAIALGGIVLAAALAGRKPEEVTAG